MINFTHQSLDYIRSLIGSIKPLGRIVLQLEKEWVFPIGLKTIVTLRLRIESHMGLPRTSNPRSEFQGDAT